MEDRVELCYPVRTSTQKQFSSMLDKLIKDLIELREQSALGVEDTVPMGYDHEAKERDKVLHKAKTDTSEPR